MLQAYWQQLLRARGENVNSVSRIGRIAADCFRHQGMLLCGYLQEPGLIDATVLMNDQCPIKVRALRKEDFAIDSHKFRIDSAVYPVSNAAPNEFVGPNETSVSPLSLERALALGVHLHRAGHFRQAEEVYRSVLARDPNQVDALHFLGLLLYKAGFQNDGLEFIQKAVAQCPRYADAQSNLGNLLRDQGRLTEAVMAYQKALEINPCHPQAWNNLGVALKDLGRLDQAMAAFRKAFEVAPTQGDAHLNLATVLTLRGREQEAIAEYRRGLELEPSLIHGFDALIRGLRNQGQDAEALEVLNKLKQKLPDHPVVRHMLAANTGQGVPAQASQEYVRTIFDGFADTFNHVLQCLEYRAPELVTSLIRRHWPMPERRLAVLDAGCGTGLCAAHLKPYARRLTGVDLSGAMLAKARLCNCYDELVQAELTQFLQGHPASYDLICSADTLVYFGELTAVLQAAANALHPGGLLAFSLEDAQRALPAGFQLHPHGRYSHAEDYVQTTLKGAGFGGCAITKDILRKERNQPVAGLLVAAWRS